VNAQLIRAIQPMAILVLGMGTVLTLAMQRILVDGETVAALSAVLSTAMGSRALESRPHSGGGDPDA
jgi:hypothetical protein